MKKNCQDYKPLLMGFIDRELTTSETIEVNDHLTRCSDCRNEYEQLIKVSQKLDSLSFREPSDEVLDKLWKTPYGRFTKFSGLFLAIGGWLVLVFYGVYEFLIDKEEAFIPKMATLALMLGLIIILIVTVRERVKTYKTDKYKEIKR